MTGIPGKPYEYYFGAVGGGVWHSSNAGRTWESIFDGQPISSIGAIAVAPSDPKIIYAGSGEADMRSDISFGDGMYKSTDGGATWRNIGLRDSEQIGRVIVDPHDPRVVLVAALGHAFGPNSERGVYRSTDGGETWSKVLGKNDDTGAIDLCFDPGNSQVVYASLWQARRPPWTSYAPTSGPGSGLYKSGDGGVTWRQISGHGFPSEGLGRIGIAVAPGENGNRVYAIVDATDGGMYRSDDAGASWRRVSSDHRIWMRGWYFGGVTADPRNPEVVYVANTSLYRSADGGANFTAIKGAPGGDDYHQLWIAPEDPNRMVLG
ncbi:MAG: WD40/YVTN/BNR-like repeat-containing protein, partial [Candidatus Binataceae bacterium]